MQSLCNCPPESPFLWRTRAGASVIVRERVGEWNGNGRSPSQRATETKDRVEAETGRSLAVAGPLSRRSNWASVK